MMYSDGVGEGARDGIIPMDICGDGETTGGGTYMLDGSGYGYDYGNGYGDHNMWILQQENPHCTRLIDGDNIPFIQCQQVMLS